MSSQSASKVRIQVRSLQMTKKILGDKMKPEQNYGGNMEVINTGFKVTLLLETQSYPVDRLIPGANHLISLEDLA